MRVRIPWRFPLAAALAVACGESPTEPEEPALRTAGGKTLVAPTELSTLALSDREVQLRWVDNSTNEDGFEVLRSATGPEGPFSRLALLAVGATMHLDAALAPATEYCYVVRAYIGVREKPRTLSAQTPASCATTAALGAPRTPTYVSATPGSSTRIDVSWQDASSDETLFRVERSLDGGSSWETAGTQTHNWVPLYDGFRTPEQRVCYRVFAVKEELQSAPSPTDCATPPAVPANVTGTFVSGSVDLAWEDNSSAESGFRIMRRVAGGWEVTTIATLPANATTYRDTPPSGPTGYAYRVQALSDGGAGTASEEALVRMSSEPLAPPTGFAARQAPDYLLHYAHLTWTDNSTGEQGFHVQRAPSADGPWSDVTGQWLGPDYQQAWLNHGFGQRVCYRVRAFFGDDRSEPSNVGCLTLPGVPGGIRAVAATEEQAVDVTWDPNTPFATGLELERHSQPDAGGPVLISLGADVTSFRDVAVSPNVRYSYRIRARGSEGVSSFGAMVSVLISTTPPATPTGLAATPVGYAPPDVELTWVQNDANVAAHTLERSLDRGASWDSIGTLDAGSTSYYAAAPDVHFERELCYRLVAINSAGRSAPSDAACTAYPAQPTVTSQSLAADGVLSITWTDHSNVEDGYQIWVYEGDEWSGYYLSTIIDLDANTTSWSGNAGWWIAYVRVVARRGGGPYY